MPRRISTSTASSTSSKHLYREILERPAPGRRLSPARRTGQSRTGNARTPAAPASRKSPTPPQRRRCGAARWSTGWSRYVDEQLKPGVARARRQPRRRADRRLSAPPRRALPPDRRRPVLRPPSGRQRRRDRAARGAVRARRRIPRHPGHLGLVARALHRVRDLSRTTARPRRGRGSSVRRLPGASLPHRRSHERPPRAIPSGELNVTAANSQTVEFFAASGCRTYAELGVYEGDTALAIATSLDGAGELHLFDFEDRVVAVAARLQRAGHENVFTHANSRRLLDSYNWSLMQLLAESIAARSSTTSSWTARTPGHTTRSPFSSSTGCSARAGTSTSTTTPGRSGTRPR